MVELYSIAIKYEKDPSWSFCFQQFLENYFGNQYWNNMLQMKYPTPIFSRYNIYYSSWVKILVVYQFCIHLITPSFTYSVSESNFNYLEITRKCSKFKSYGIFLMQGKYPKTASYYRTYTKYTLILLYIKC